MRWTKTRRRNKTTINVCDDFRDKFNVMCVGDAWFCFRVRRKWKLSFFCDVRSSSGIMLFK